MILSPVKMEKNSLYFKFSTLEKNAIAVARVYQLLSVEPMLFWLHLPEDHFQEYHKLHFSQLQPNLSYEAEIIAVGIGGGGEEG